MKEVMKFTDEANIHNNCFFVDSVDDVLKFKDAQGIVHVVSLVPCGKIHITVYGE